MQVSLTAIQFHQMELVVPISGTMRMTYLLKEIGFGMEIIIIIIMKATFLKMVKGVIYTKKYVLHR
jgi:hypothetical protein